MSVIIFNMKLILFDIDGTLIDSGEAGTRALNLAFEEVFSIPDAFKGISMAGKTDIQIMREALRIHGLDSENGNIETLCKGYLRHLKKEIENPRRHLKPYAGEVLKDLSGKEDFVLGLLTGNIREGARIKLGPFGIHQYFTLGAFGDDDEDRNRLLPVAVKRFREVYKKDINYKDCIVIGDTPRDVECAKVHGAIAIAVATGPYSYETLLNSGADLVFSDMSELLINGYQALHGPRYQPHQGISP